MVILALLLYHTSLDVLSHFRGNAIQECLILADQSDRIACLSPSGIATNFDSLRFDLRGQLGQIWGHGTLWQRR